MSEVWVLEYRREWKDRGKLWFRVYYPSYESAKQYAENHELWDVLQPVQLFSIGELSIK